MLTIDLFVKSVDFRIVPNRKQAFTIDLENQFLDGTDLFCLNQIGIESIEKYVNSSFKSLPKRIILRTDGKEQLIEDLVEGSDEVEAIIEEAAIAMDENEYGNIVD